MVWTFGNHLERNRMKINESKDYKKKKNEDRIWWKSPVDYIRLWNLNQTNVRLG